MSIWDFLFPVERSISVAAFIGTVVLLLNGKKRAKTAVLTMVLGNYLTAVYLAPLVAEFSNLKSTEGIAFAIAVGGFSLIDRIINQIFNRIESLKDENPDNSIG